MNAPIFETLSPARLFFRCAVPSMIGMAMSACYSIADGIFVGHFIGQNALAAVNLVMPLAMIAFALADRIAVGSSVRVSMLLGQKDSVWLMPFAVGLLRAVTAVAAAAALPRDTPLAGRPAKE